MHACMYIHAQKCTVIVLCRIHIPQVLHIMFMQTWLVLGVLAQASMGHTVMLELLFGLLLLSGVHFALI
jgi:hypothetical protein